MIQLEDPKSYEAFVKLKNKLPSDWEAAIYNRFKWLKLRIFLMENNLVKPYSYITKDCDSYSKRIILDAIWRTICDNKYIKKITCRECGRDIMSFYLKKGPCPLCNMLMSHTKLGSWIND